MHRNPILRNSILFLGLVALTAVWSSSSMAERRVALVIGNGAYKNVQPLPNPSNDATAMANVLQQLGFEVISATNLDNAGMSKHISRFSTASQGADVALFFYAGHGMQMGGKNYLVPVEADLKREIDVRTGALDVDIMLDAMADAKVKLVFLDACRDNPFVNQVARSMRGSTRSTSVSSGLAEMKSGEGTMLAYATAPGQVALDGEGGNSPFTRALIENLPTPGQEISISLKKVRASVGEQTRKQQMPWENTNMTGEFYMIPPAPGASPPGGAVATAPVATHAALGVAAEIELETWKSVKDSSNANELQEYLRRYPNGSFANIARMRIASLAPAKEATSAIAANPAAAAAKTADIARTTESSSGTEDALSLDYNSRVDLQRRLTALGFNTGGVDGSFGDGTRRAIRNWQTARRHYVSGYFNKLQVTSLRSEALPAVTVTRSSTPAQQQNPRPQQRQNNGGDGNSAAAAAAIGFIGGAILGRAIGR